MGVCIDVYIIHTSRMMLKKRTNKLQEVINVDMM